MAANSPRIFSPPPGHYTVLGASGMFGSHALRALAGKPGITVTAVHNARPVRIQASNIRTVRADLLDPQQYTGLIDGTDNLLIFAGVVATAPVLKRDPVTPVLTTLRITINALEAARRAGVKRVVWMSSTTGYPPLDEELAEELMFEGDPPPTWYSLGWAIRYLESLCRSFAETFEPRMAITALRPTLAYGEFDHFDDETAHFLPAMIRRVVKRESPIEVWGDGSQTRDLIYAGDVVDAAWAALEREKGFEAFNIATGHSFSVNEVLGRICAIDGYENDAGIVHRMDKPGSISSRRFSSEKARNILQFTPRTSLDEGLKRTIEWYREDGKR